MTTNVPVPKAKTWYGDRKLILLTALLIVSVALLSWEALRQIKAQVRSHVRHNLQSVLDTTNEAVNGWSAGRIDDLELIVSRPDFQQLVQEQLALRRQPGILAAGPALRRLRQILAPYLQHHQDLDFFIVAPDRINVASLDDGELGHPNFLAGTLDHYLGHLFAGTQQLILPLPGDRKQPVTSSRIAPKQPIMFIGVPIPDQAGRAMAVLTVAIDPGKDFSRIIIQARSGETGDTYAFDKTGRLISAPRFETALRMAATLSPEERASHVLMLRDPGGDTTKGFRPRLTREERPLTRMVRSATAGENGIDLEGYRDYRGVPVVGAWLWNKAGQYGLAFEVDVAEAYASYATIRRTLAVIFSAVVVVFLTIATGLFRRNRQVESVNRQLNQEIKKRGSSERKFRVLLNSAPDGIILVNRHGRIVLVNRQIEEMFGLPPEELVAQTVEALVPKLAFFPDQEGKNDAPPPAALGAINTRTDLAGRHRDGHEFPVEIRLSPVAIDEEPAVIVSVRDVSLRRQTEQHLAKVRAGLAEAQRIARLGNWEWDITTDTLCWSDELYRIFGLPRQPTGLNYETFIQAIHPDERESVKQAITQAILHHTPYAMTHRIIHPVGEERVIHVQGEVFYAGDEPSSMFGTAQDITQRHKAEKELQNYREQLERLVEERTRSLQESEETLRIIASSAPVAIVMIADDGGVSFWNEAAETIFGWSASDVLGRRLHEFIANEEDRAEHLKSFRQFQKSGTGPTVGMVLEKMAVRKNGEIFPAELKVSAVRIKDKWCAIGLVSDISLRKNTEEQARRHLEELERFNRLATGRELKMIELKREINALLAELGREKKYLLATNAPPTDR